MSQKYFLYIDILGFSELVSSNPEAVEELYQIIDDLNVHRHDAFTTIVFSDTILVYNREDPTSDYDHRYLVMYSIEFAQNLFYRLIGKDIYFRATLRYGAFAHKSLKHIDAYYGTALIDSYRDEKHIPAIGVFLHRSVWAHNDIFHTVPFTKDYSFAIINQALLAVWKMFGDHAPLPISGDVFFGQDNEWHIASDVIYFRSIYHHMTSHPEPAVRAKYLATWQLYRCIFQKALDSLELHHFDPNALVSNFDWGPAMDRAIDQDR